MKLSPPRTLSMFGLVMINVIAIDSLRTLPLTAEYGFSAVFYYFVTAIIFFLPTAFVAAELATGWPETGGVYIWVREAFGKKMGFLTIWLQWFYNICWYPTIMSLIAATLAYCINPSLVQSKAYMLTVILIIFWGTTLVNCLGMSVSSVLSNISAMIGTILPMLFIILLGIVWIVSGRPLGNEFSFKTFIPDLSNIHNLVLLTAMLYGLIGMEMSASHAREVKDPQRDYPKAMLWSVLIILFTMIFGTLAIVVVVPISQLSIVAGLLQAFQIFFIAFHLKWLMPVIALMIVCGAIGGAAAWMLGPSKGILMASRDGCLPEGLGKLSSRHTPIRVLLLQGVIFTLICMVFLLMPTVSSGFWVLSDITAILALGVYVAMFLAALYLRYKKPEVKRAFKIPGGKIGIWIVCLLGLGSSLFTIMIGFLPPSQIPVGNVVTYETILILGVLLGCLLPFLFYGINQWLVKLKAKA
ncbi:MAG: transporter [Gammaproteobacteria bacterium RIFCSPHIGHO2_12_FULL_35_23]|nr:MAG: transporter [Gammaproteobacteria bacterium RIFCSPHIGHO2_12_FULL_35_23]